MAEFFKIISKKRVCIFVLLLFFISVIIIYSIINNKKQSIQKEKYSSSEINEKNNNIEKKTNNKEKNVKEEIDPKITTNNSTTTSSSVINIDVPKTENNNINHKNDLYDNAVKKKDSSYCDLIKDIYTKDLCIKKVAIISNNKVMCEKISSEKEKNNCIDLIYINKAEKNKDISICEKIKKEYFRFMCQTKLVEDGIDESECDKIPLMSKEEKLEIYNKQEPRDICISNVMYREFLLDKTMTNCEKIPICDIKARCLADLANTTILSDDDSDGLNFVNEICRFTDPNNPDTDGDGYTDGEEVESHHNPLGDKIIYSHTQ